MLCVVCWYRRLGSCNVWICKWGGPVAVSVQPDTSRKRAQWHWEPFFSILYDSCQVSWDFFYPSFWGYLKKRISRDFEGFCWIFEGFRGIFGILGDSFVFFGGGALRILGIFWVSWGFWGIFLHFLGFCWIHEGFFGIFWGFLRDFKGFFYISWDFVKDLMGFLGFLMDFMGYFGFLEGCLGSLRDFKGSFYPPWDF